MNSTEIAVCPACGRAGDRLLFKWKGKVPIHQCGTCDTQYSKQRFTAVQLRAFYSENYFVGDFGYRNYDAVEAMKQLTFRDRLDRIATECPERGRLLDVGCATGTLVREALKKGWDAHGIDISEYAVQQGRVRDGAELSVRLKPETIQACSHASGGFDVLTLSDMIEHVHEPAEIIQAAHRLLRQDGVLFIETPNVSGLMRRLMRSHWPMYRPPEHLVYFSPRSLGSLLRREGFSLRSWRPSLKALTWNYIISKLAVNQPLWTALQLGPLVGDWVFWVPAGSFWTLARRL